MSLASKGRFITTGPSGKSPEGDILDHNFSFPASLAFGARKLPLWRVGLCVWGGGSIPELFLVDASGPSSR